MATRLVFYWCANSLLFMVTLSQIVIVAFAVWATMTLCGTRVLAWVFAKEPSMDADLA